MYKLTTRTEDLKALQAFTARPDAQRLALEGVHITPEYIEATDGHGLLRINREMVTTDAPAGVYRIEAIKKIGGGISEAIIAPLDVVYPPTDAVIPAAPSKYTPDLVISDDKKRPGYISETIIYLYKNGCGAFALFQLERLTGICGRWTVQKPKTEGGAVRLDYDAGAVKYIAVILPYKQEA